jgi:hypothetical protein
MTPSRRSPQTRTQARTRIQARTQTLARTRATRCTFQGNEGEDLAEFGECGFGPCGDADYADFVDVGSARELVTFEPFSAPSVTFSETCTAGENWGGFAGSSFDITGLRCL